MEQQHQTNVARLVPHETFGPDVRALSPYALADDDMDYGDVICLGLEEISRHLKWLDDDYQSGQFERLEVRLRSIVMLGRSARLATGSGKWRPMLCIVLMVLMRWRWRQHCHG